MNPFFTKIITFTFKAGLGIFSLNLIINHGIDILNWNNCPKEFLPEIKWTVIAIYALVTTVSLGIIKVHHYYINRGLHRIAIFCDVAFALLLLLYLMNAKQQTLSYWVFGIAFALATIFLSTFFQKLISSLTLPWLEDFVKFFKDLFANDKND